MNLRNIDLNLLVILQKLLETRHITKTAEQLNMSQPAVSRALQRLRHTFNDPILVKTKHGYDISARMIDLEIQLQGTLKNIQGMLSQPNFDPSTSTETIKFFCPDLEAILFLPAFNTYIKNAAPNMRLYIQSQPSEHFDFLTSGEVHFTMSAKKPEASISNIKSLCISEEKQVCITGANHKFRNEKITLDNYLDCPHGIVSITDHGNEIGEIDIALSKLKKKRDIMIRLPNFASIPYFCEQNDIIFTMPENLALKLSQHHDIILKPTPPELNLQSFEFYLYWHERNNLDPMCIWIRETLSSLFTK
ncbi:MAG: LysR family transcriptional regulator [Alphaproteobacteria bacterium]